MQNAKQTKLRTTRIANLTAALFAQRAANKASAFAHATAAAAQSAYLAQLAALQAAHGINPAHHTLSVRNANNTQQHQPSAQPGACKLVRAWVQNNPTATVAQALLHFAPTGTQYVNPATVKTQYRVAKQALAAL